ncbi:MAG: MFS transporter [Candidatus Eisenbacteria bacterium]|uniref:MFS transporter n=1 Tax=Eiseniibacteriota bacterium TaxID=2212470 RepID=A0A948W7B8_UNCEI|nr:MFS transporter [Candidatus Eisenbacteria bacterium]MBU1947340.1 MFS transporter [Candidatus Eisenbacteria bacterium]MBU2692065.1 MFS transporter [Candidatus Eisenbacteria bacterium]
MAVESKTQNDRFDSGGVLAISAGHALHDTYTAFLPPLLPAFIQKFALSRTEAGLLSVFIQGASLLQPFIGHLADRVSLRYFVILTPALSAILMSLLGIAPGYGWLALLLLLAGISSAGLHAVGPVLAGHLSGSNLGRGMGFWMVGGELGRTLGPIIIVSAVGVLSLNGTPWLMTGGLAISILLFYKLRRIPERPAAAREGRPWRQTLVSMRAFLLPLSAIVFTRAFALVALTIYLPTFLIDQGSDLWTAGASLSILEGAGVAGALLGGTLSDRIGRRAILFLSLGATPPLMMLFLFSGGWLRLLSLVLMGFTALSTTPVIMAMVQEQNPENRALANGIYMAMSFSLRALVVIIYGGLGDSFGMRTAFTISAVMPLIGCPFIMRLPLNGPSASKSSVLHRS